MELVEKARKFARAAHKGQMRKDGKTPYFVHVERVAAMLIGLGASENLVSVGYLHDTVEDTEVTQLDLLAEFGDEIADFVDELSNKFKLEDKPEWNRAKRKEAEHKRMQTISADAKMIKLCDRLDNMMDLESDTDGDNFAKVYTAETFSLLEAMYPEYRVPREIKHLFNAIIFYAEKP